MYDTKYVCQYKNVDVFLETDTIDDLTKDKIRKPIIDVSDYLLHSKTITFDFKPSLCKITKFTLQN